MKNSKNKLSGFLDTTGKMLKYPLGKPKTGSVKYSEKELTTDPVIARKCFKQIIGVYIEWKPGAKKLEDLSDAEVLFEMKRYLDGVKKGQGK
jgi:hypothetical protein